jgi:hypothetical protein
VAELVNGLVARVTTLAGEWTKYSVIGSFVLYLFGYLALRFHITAIGIGTDFAILDERYVYTGAHFVVYLVAAIANVVFVSLLFVLVGSLVGRRLSADTRIRVRVWMTDTARLTVFGIVFAVVMIQLVMRQCFLIDNLLLAADLGHLPGWLVALLSDDDDLTMLYFTALVAGCALSIAILLTVARDQASKGRRMAIGTLAFLAATQVLLLPINFGVLTLDKVLPRVATVGGTALAEGETAWLVWEGKEGVTFLIRGRDQSSRRLLTLPRSDVKSTEIVRFDRIVPLLFNTVDRGE